MLTAKSDDLDAKNLLEYLVGNMKDKLYYFVCMFHVNVISECVHKPILTLSISFYLESNSSHIPIVTLHLSSLQTEELFVMKKLKVYIWVFKWEFNLMGFKLKCSWI